MVYYINKMLDLGKNSFYLKLIIEGVIQMGFLRWLGGIVVFFWILGFILKIGGGAIHILLVVAAIVFIFDFIFGRGRS